MLQSKLSWSGNADLSSWDLNANRFVIYIFMILVMLMFSVTVLTLLYLVVSRTIVWDMMNSYLSAKFYCQWFDETLPVVVMRFSHFEPFKMATLGGYTPLKFWAQRF